MLRNSPGGKRRLDHTGIQVLSQYPAGGGMMRVHGLLHRHLTAQWRLRMWPCRFLAGQRSQHGRLFLLPAR